MGKPVNNETELKPVVEKAIKSLYGEAMQNINILKADQIPLFRQPKRAWLVNIGFNDDKYKYSVQLDVQISNGRIIREVELHRIPVKK